MRLLHTRELKFQEFFDAGVPEYAIFSHRWGADEVSYQDFLIGAKQGGTGYKKILGACKYAANDMQMLEISNDQTATVASHKQILKPHLEDVTGELDTEDPWIWVEAGFQWIWIDTCCIDKTSSSEMSEAINSMYKWYARSGVCYAYLADVITPSVAELGNSQWFTRGWTLQELFAPRTVIFLDQEWQEIAQRDSHRSLLSSVTGICPYYLDGRRRSDLGGIRAAERFSWAAERKTSRREDRAYSLIGLFGINMPLLYGEGERAFRRLQRKVLKLSGDESIFLWDLPWPSDDLHGLLAESIASFGSQSTDQPGLGLTFSKIPGLTRPPYLVTNQGLQIHVPKDLAEKQDILLPLDCQYVQQDGARRAYAIRLERISYEGRWARIFHEDWSDTLPPLGVDVQRVSASFGLFLVPVDWVWSRKDLAKRGGEIIFVIMDDLGNVDSSL